MDDSVQATLDGFARKLAALTAEFEALQRKVGATPAVASPPQHAPTLSPQLRRLDELVRAEQGRAALKEADRVRYEAFASGSTDLLEELLSYVRGFPSNPPWVGRALFMTERDLEFLHGRGAQSVERKPDVPFPPGTATPPPRPPKPPRELPQFELDLLGPRALAVAGGIVTLLGIIFFFVLAADRGWIGPHARIALGGIAAALVFGSGLELKRRFGTTYATLAAVGAGIAGGYATLLSAASLYHMLSDWTALVVAGAIAAVGLATSLFWRSQIVGGIGLLGAMVVPMFIAAQGGVSVLPVAFAAVVFAVLAGVSISLGWRALLVAGALGSAPQLLALVFNERYHYQSPPSVIALVAIFFLVYAATGVVLQLRVTSTRVDPLATPFILGAGLVAGGSLARLLATNEQRGVGLMILAGAYVLPGALFFIRKRTRDLSAVLTFATFTLMAIGFALLLHGDALAYAWAAEAAGLAWLARTVREIRYQLWSGVYLVMAVIHSLFDAPPRHLDYPGLTPDAVTAHPAAGVGTIVAVAAAAAVFSFYARPWSEDDLPGGERLRDAAYEGYAKIHRPLRLGTAWLTLLLTTYAASLGMLAVLSSSSTYGDMMVHGFVWGTVANSGLWMAIGLVLLAFGFRRAVEHLRVGALVWLGLTAFLALIQASRFLVDNPRAVAVAVIGAAAVVTSFAYGMSRHEGVDRGLVISVSTALISVALLVYPVAYRLDGHWEGAALLGLAALYAVLSAVLGWRRARDASTAYWAIAIGLAILADVRLLDGTYAVLGWAAAGVAVAWLARRVQEPRLYVGASVLVGLSAVRAFAVQAPPTHLFRAQLNPAHGTASIFIAAAAVAVLAYLALAELDRMKSGRRAPWWLSGGLAVYGLSILILEFVEWVSNANLATIDTEFQRGQTAVSAFWGLLGLALLYVGLKRRKRMLRIAGLAFFPISLAKIFLYDLPNLSSVTRALSFLAVGAVLLLGGFFYQRLTAAWESPCSLPSSE